MPNPLHQRAATARSSLGGIGCPGGLFGDGASPRQRRIAIFIAIARKELLADAERRYPALNFFAHITVPGRREAGWHEHFAGGNDIRGPVRRGRPGRDIRIPRVSRDRLYKRHGLRDQKVALLLPLHATPQHWWSDSSIRIPSQQALLRMLESQDHQQIWVSSGVWDLIFASKTRG